MIDKSHRFHGRTALGKLHRSGQVVRAQGLSLKFAPAKAAVSYRAAVIVSKKVHKSAVVRNRIRRRVYEIIRREVVGTPADFAVQVYDIQYALLPAAQVEMAVSGLLAKAGLRAK